MYNIGVLNIHSERALKGNEESFEENSQWITLKISNPMKVDFERSLTFVRD